MTYRSLFVEEHGSRESALEPYERGRDVAILGSLNAYNWPHPAFSFARDHALPVDYVDNCWLRVTMSASELTRFLQSGEKPPIEAVELLPKIKSDSWYVVNEEEF